MEGEFAIVGLGKVAVGYMKGSCLLNQVQSWKMSSLTRKTAQRALASGTQRRMSTLVARTLYPC